MKPKPDLLNDVWYLFSSTGTARTTCCVRLNDQGWVALKQTQGNLAQVICQVLKSNV